MTKLKVLLVDDEIEFVKTLAERLQLRGFEVLVAVDGEGAINQMEADLPDLVVLDVMMPGLGGLEVLKQIKQQHQRIPIILLTGHSSTSDGIKGMRLGAFDYLMKPIDIDELIKKMQEAVTSGRNHAET